MLTFTRHFMRFDEIDTQMHYKDTELVIDRYELNVSGEVGEVVVERMKIEFVTDKKNLDDIIHTDSLKVEDRYISAYRLNYEYTNKNSSVQITIDVRSAIKKENGVYIYD